MSAVPAPAVPEVRQAAPRFAIASDRPVGDLLARLGCGLWELVGVVFGGPGTDGAHWFLRDVSFGAMAGAGDLRSVRDCVCGVSVCRRVAQRDCT